MFKGMEESAHLTPDKSPDRKDFPIMNLAVPHQGLARHLATPNGPSSGRPEHGRSRTVAELYLGSAGHQQAPTNPVGNRATLS